MDALFFSYSHKDEILRDQLETQLTMLKRQGVISVWHDRRLIVGDHVDAGISKQLEDADIILESLDPSLFPGVPSDVHAHSGFAGSHSRQDTLLKFHACELTASDMLRRRLY